MITQERVRELFDYREDGVLVRRVKVGRHVAVGDVAGFPGTRGYLNVKVDWKAYRIHRLVFLWHNGYMPENGIDHINRDKIDNRIENLREVGHTCNARNTSNRKNNTSGVKGISWSNEMRKWRAQIRVGGKEISLGQSADFLEAVCHRLAAEQAEGWSGCDSSSPAFKYVQENICCMVQK